MASYYFAHYLYIATKIIKISIIVLSVNSIKGIPHITRNLPISCINR